jgi:hypothetical protein
MISFSELKQKVDNFINDMSYFDESDHISSSGMSGTAEEELKASGGHLHVDQFNHTDRMHSEYVGPAVRRFHKWDREAEKWEHQLNAKRESLSTAKAKAEVDKIEAEHKQSVDAINQEFNDGELGQKRKELDEAVDVYEKMRKANGNKPPRKLPFWYFIVLLVIGAGEWLINYETFAAKFEVVAMSIGMTLLVALSFAAASHFHGEFLKQRVALVGAHVPVPRKRTHYTFQILATLLMLASLVAVVLVRYLVLTEELGSSGPGLPGGLPGSESNTQESVFQLLLPTVLLNLAVYLLGLVISYAVHDSVPDYQRAKKDMERAQEEHKRVDKKRQEKVKQVGEEMRAKKQEVGSVYEDNFTESQRCQQLLDQIQARRDKVAKSTLSEANSRAQKYRSILVGEARKLGMDEMVVGPESMSLQQYLEITIDLNKEQIHDYV